MSHTPTGRRKGGQPGNTNRLRHGLYSKRLSSPETTPPNYNFQLTLYRRRLAQLLSRQEHATVRDFLSYERGILQYISLILELRRSTSLPPEALSSDLIDADGHPSYILLDNLGPDEAVASNLPLPSTYPIRTSSDPTPIPADFLLQSWIRTSNCSSTAAGAPTGSRSDHELDE